MCTLLREAEVAIGESFRLGSVVQWCQRPSETSAASNNQGLFRLQALTALFHAILMSGPKRLEHPLNGILPSLYVWRVKKALDGSY